MPATTREARAQEDRYEHSIRWAFLTFVMIAIALLTTCIRYFGFQSVRTVFSGGLLVLTVVLAWAAPRMRPGRPRG
jgi:hypothetical protein